MPVNYSAEDLEADNTIKLFVSTGDQVGSASSVQASTTTERFVAQEMMKLKLLGCAPKFGPI